jgi:hypothetical protein
MESNPIFWSKLLHNFHREKSVRKFWQIPHFSKIPLKVSNHPMSENSPTIVTPPLSQAAVLLYPQNYGSDTNKIVLCTYLPR